MTNINVCTGCKYCIKFVEWDDPESFLSRSPQSTYMEGEGSLLFSTT